MGVSVAQTVATLRARAEATRAAQDARAQQLRTELAERVRELLPVGATARLIGSLAWGGFGERSDVDLVLEGIDATAACQLELQLTRDLGVAVEVLRTEELPAPFRRRVEQEGISLRGA